MKKLLFILLCLLSLFAQAQTYQNRPEYGWNFKRIKIDSTLTLPKDTGIRSNVPDPGAIVYQVSDKSIYTWDGARWNKITSATSLLALDSAYRSQDSIIFHKTLGGTLGIKLNNIPISGIISLTDSLLSKITVSAADIRYPLLSGSYNNPSWITGLAWSKITGRPTTLAGYGITDAAPISGGSGYIQNQNAGPQSASGWINSTFRATNIIRVDNNTNSNLYTSIESSTVDGVIRAGNGSSPRNLTFNALGYSFINPAGGIWAAINNNQFNIDSSITRFTIGYTSTNNPPIVTGRPLWVNGRASGQDAQADSEFVVRRQVPLLVGAYNNPSWITGLAWSKITVPAGSFVPTNFGVGGSPSVPMHVFSGIPKTTNTTTNIMAIASNDVIGSTDLSLLFRQKGSATAALRYYGITSYENGTGPQSLVLQDLGGNLGISDLQPSSKLSVNGSISIPSLTITGSTTLNNTHYTVLCNNSANIVVTLPAASACNGRIYNIKKIASGAFTVTIQGNGAENIDAANTLVITAQWDSKTIQSNGTQWYIL